MAKPREYSTLLDASQNDTPRTIADFAYEAAISGEGWSGILEDLSRSLNAKAAALIEFRPHAQLTSPLAADSRFIHQSVGLEPGFEDSYRDFYGAQDVWMRRLDFAGGAGEVIRGEDLVPERLLLGSDYYTGWLAPQNLFHSMFVVLMLSAESHIVCAMYRGEQDGRFDSKAAKAFSQEAVHLGRALKIHGILSRTAVERDAALAALDQNPIGVIVVDDTGMVLDSNHVANEVLSDNDGLAVDRYVLKSQSREATSNLHALIAAAIHRDPHDSDPAEDTISLERPSGRPNLAVTVARLPLSGRFLGSDRRVAAIYITDPEKAFSLDATKLRRLYGLTPAEARLAALLAQGSRLEEAATDLGVSLNTVRTHLKRIFSKTGTDRQAELVRVILSGPARIMLDNGD